MELLGGKLNETIHEKKPILCYNLSNLFALWITLVLCSQQICNRPQGQLVGLLLHLFVFQRRSALFFLPFWHIQMLLKLKWDFAGFRWLNKECKWVNSRLHLMLFALLLLKKELRVFMLYASFNHMKISFLSHFVEILMNYIY